MKKKRIVITGGPGTGKSTLVTSLEANGEDCFHEISRDIIRKAREDGIEQLFLENPLLFSELLIDGRLQQYQNISFFQDSDNPIVFYDRGLPDVTAYLHFKSETYPASFDKVCHNNRYDAIFILPPWESIYQQDNERYESFEEALKIHEALSTTYQNYGYTPIEVPKTSIAERIRFIQTNLS